MPFDLTLGMGEMDLHILSVLARQAARQERDTAIVSRLRALFC